MRSIFHPVLVVLALVACSGDREPHPSPSVPPLAPPPELAPEVAAAPDPPAPTPALATADYTPPAPAPSGLSAALIEMRSLATGDLAGATFREDRLGVAIDAPEPGPATLQALFDRIREIAKAMNTITNDPKLGVIVRWAKNKRMAAMVWQDELGRAVPRAGAYGQVVTDSSTYRVSAFPEVRESIDYNQAKPVHTTCTGTAKNLGAEPVDLVVECRGWPTGVAKQGPPLVAKRTTIAKLKPGASKRYRIDLGRAQYGFQGVETTFMIDGAEVPWFNQFAWDEVEDFMATNDQVQAETGLDPGSSPSMVDPLALSIHHAHPVLYAVGFSALPKARQKAVSQYAWKAYQRHYSRMHNGERPLIDLSEAGVKRSLGPDGPSDPR